MPKPRKQKVSNKVRLGLFWAIIVLIGLSLYAAFMPAKPLQEVPIAQVIRDANEGKVAKIEGQGGDLQVTMKGENKPSKRTYLGGGVSSLLKDNILNEKGRAVVSDSAPVDNSLMLTLMTVVLPVLLIGALFVFMMRQAQGQNSQAMSFGKSKLGYTVSIKNA